MDAHEHGNCSLCDELEKTEIELRSEIIDLRGKIKKANEIFIEYSEDTHRWVEWERKRK